METLLLSFCLISLILSSMIVLFEVSLDAFKQKKPFQKTMPSSSSAGTSLHKEKAESPAPQASTPAEPDAEPQASTPKPASRLRVLPSRKRKPIVQDSTPEPKIPEPLETLQKQLIGLGFSSHEQQIQFINWALNTQYASPDQVSVQEFQLLFTVIRRYRAKQRYAQQRQVPQSA